MKSFRYCLCGALAAGLLQGCTILVPPPSVPSPPAPIDFSDPVLNQRRVFLVGSITEATAAQAIRQLLFLDAQNNRPIDLYLMTPGGDLKATFAVEHAMRQVRSPINTCAIGECNSGGAVLLAAGTGERRAFGDTTVVIHGMEVKNKPPTKYVELTQEAYTAFWRRHARLPKSWLPIPHGKLFVVTAREALEFGVIDKIIAPRSGEGGPSGPATENQAILSETNRTPAAAGARR
jgi:ATP-dependent Clp protease, protease subunit